eukprot:CFRG0271T1
MEAADDDLGPRRCARLWMFCILAFLTFLVTLLLLPEYFIYKNFEAAQCKVTDKVVYSFYTNEAKISNFVTVYDEDGNVTDMFEANACNPLDCNSKSGGFMDKQRWLALYTEGQVYPCWYSRDRLDGGYEWIAYDPVPYSYSIWVLWVAMVILTILVLLAYLHSLLCGPKNSCLSSMKYVWAVLRDDLGMGEKCTGCWIGLKSLLPCSTCRRYKYTRQFDFEMDNVGQDDIAEPPSYEGPMEPPPDYHHVYGE